LDGRQPSLFEYRRNLLRAIRSDANADGNWYINANPNNYPNRHTHSYRDSYANGDIHCYRNCRDSYPNCDIRGYGNADA